MSIKDLYESVTATIIKQLEEGITPWVRPWTVKGGGFMPRNFASKRAYSGVNVIILWDAQIRGDFQSSEWLTYKQAREIGAQVRGGEKATRVVFTNSMLVGEGDDEKKIGYLKSFYVFNTGQIDGLLIETHKPQMAQHSRDDAATAFIAATKADIQHGGDRAFYRMADDFIRLPDTAAFESYEHYLATGLHELTHWSGAKHRLNRDLNNRFGTKAYAAEELVAELGAAFLCAHLEVKGRLRHAEYVANWLELLKEDPRAVFTAASKASQAADFLRSFSQPKEQAA